MNIQFKKGVLEMCVLVLLDLKDCYGYELVEKISSYIEISEGTIYPLLRRLQKENYLTSYLKESKEGPPRKYYTLTKEGMNAKEELIHEWEKLIENVNIMMSQEGGLK